MRARVAAIAAALLLLASARDAWPEPAPSFPAPGRVPHLRLPAERTLCKPAEGDEAPATVRVLTDSELGELWCRQLPAGRFLDEPAWSALDIEMKRLQDAETRLKAENDVYKNAADSWSPGWKTLVGAVGLGISIGVYAATR